MSALRRLWRISVYGLTAAMLSGLAGCAMRSTAGAGQKALTTQPVDAKALTPLDRIEPRPVLLGARATSGPAEAPGEALRIYAQACAARAVNDRPRAIDLLERAIALDPASYLLQYDLAMALLGSSSNSEPALAALERAASIDDNHFDLQFQLGRIYLARQNYDQAIRHLRQALMTDDVPRGDSRAVVVNLLLGRALQQKGYDMAALKQYEQVLRQLVHSRTIARGSPELTYFTRHPQALHVQMGDLSARLGMYDAALAAYRAAADREPANMEFQKRLVTALLAVERAEDARKLSRELVVKLRGSAASVALLSDTWRLMGRENQIGGELKSIVASRPKDLPLLLGVSDALRQSGQPAEAEKLLLSAAGEHGDDLGILRRLFEICRERQQVDRCANLIIEASAGNPDLAESLAPLWSQLIRPGVTGRMRLADVQAVACSKRARAAHLYWSALTGQVLGREITGRTLMEQATDAAPVFAPAYRVRMNDLLGQAALSEGQKAEAGQKLIAQARKGGDESLASELRGVLLLSQNKSREAVGTFEAAIKSAARPSAQLQASLATALLASGQVARAESILWKVVSDWPEDDTAYRMLYSHHIAAGSAAQAVHVLRKWREMNPDSITGRLVEVNLYLATGQLEDARDLIVALFADEPESDEVIAPLAVYFRQAGKMNEFFSVLEKQRQRQPGNRTVAEALVLGYVAEKRIADATRVIDQLRAAAAKDAEVLYSTAHLYERVDQSEQTEAALGEVLKLDPRHPGANNDLGYMWADAGKRLADAERMIRAAIQSEPDNGAFLDSMGWVLYKRSQFAEAERYLAQAVSATARPDPVVLDHLGDVLYRLEKADEAVKHWRWSLNRLPESSDGERGELAQLRLQLREKLRQHDAGQPVKVAPVAERATAAPAVQASK